MDIGQYESLILDNWAFAGTIVSIILAVIAILYTFDQSSTTVASTKKLEESANRVEVTTKELKNNNVKMVVSELEEKLSNILSKMQNEITNEFRAFSLFSEQKVDNSPVDINLNMSDEDWKKYVHKNITKDLTFEGLFISYAYYLFIHKKNYNFQSTVEWFENMGMDKSGSEIGNYIVQGRFMLLKSFNIINYEPVISEDINVAKVSDINNTLKKEIDIIFNGQDNNESIKHAIEALNKTFARN
ncbi:hypothetical protein MKY80_15635 [Lysinibacillus sp. FSL R5-0849]|uniref:hypothetical protein n=1 Tax=Lysinibacillus sp. FSL R5-0849 TaxID=2921660 RepID=UPI003159B5FA